MVQSIITLYSMHILNFKQKVMTQIYDVLNYLSVEQIDIINNSDAEWIALIDLYNDFGTELIVKELDEYNEQYEYIMRTEDLMELL